MYSLPILYILNAGICHEKSVDIVYTGTKMQDIGRLAYRSSGRKNPGLYKLINKAVDMEPVTGPAYRFAPGSGPQRTQQRSLEPGAKKGHNNKGIYR